MKKLITILFLAASLTGWGQVILVDSYSVDNFSGNGAVLYAGNYLKTGQTFTVTNSVIIDSVKLYLQKFGLPTGNTYTYISNISGTYGTNGLPSDSLAVSSTLNVASFTTSGILYKLTYSTRLLLTPAYYALTVSYYGGDATNYMSVLRDATSPSHSGNVYQYRVSDGWVALNTRDAIFYIYGKGLIKNISGKARNNTHKRVAGVAAASIKKIQTLTY